MKDFIYKKLCNYCDRILLSNKNSLSILAYSKLHVIKNHPEFIKEYIPIKSESKKKIKVKVIFFLLSIVNYIKLFFFEKPNFYLKKKKSKKIDVLIVSHLINTKHLNLDSDFYFGQIKKKLKKIKLSSKIILRNETPYLSKYLFKNLKKDKIILSKRTYFIKEIEFIMYAFFEFLRFNLFFDKFIFNKKKINFFNLRSFGYIVYNLRLNFAVNRLLKIFNPKYILITFEGHAWERLVIRNIKKNNDIKIFAYQFSSITKNHHSLFRKLDINSNPDCILTTSKHTQDIFKKRYDCPVEIIGSQKFTKPNLNKSKNNKSVLILPEAYTSESKLMLNFAIKASKKIKNIKFYLRLHPMINIKQLNVNLKKFPNIELSNCKIEDDFRRCDYFLYRGSAAAVQAASYGLNPIYFGKFDKFNVNPLFQVLEKKYYIDDIVKLNNFFNYETYIKQNKVRLYANNFFKKMTISKKIFNIK
jgi:hypothetical protein